MKSKTPNIFFWRKRKQYPVPTVCRNCGTKLISRYCHNCGQDLFSGFNRSIRDFIYNTFDTMFAWDNKLFNTLKYLLFVPGKLTKEYLSGKVIRYVHPAKLFWFVSIIFFAVFTFWAGPDVSDQKLFGVDEKGKVESPFVGAENVRSENDDKDEGNPNNPGNVGGVNAVELSVGQEDQVFQNAQPDKPKFRKKDITISDILDYVPYAMFLVIPFFAFLLQIFFYGKQRHYASHLIFAFHFHTFVFILFTIVSIVDHYFSAYDTITDKLFLWLPPLYFIIALFVVYRPKIWAIIWKVPLIMFIYFLAVIAVLFTFILLVLRYIHGVNIFDM